MAWAWDRNSRFFHRVTHSRNARNTIRKIITADGRILTSLPDIRQEAATHFETFLNGSQQNHARLPQEELSALIGHQCSTEEASRIMKPLLAAEIKEVLLTMPSNKASGPDGFPMEFYNAAWPVIEKYFVTTVQYFFIYGFMP